MPDRGRRLLNAPNLVTLLRIVLIPLIVAVFYLPDAWLAPEGKNLAATAIFIVAAVTDWLDGWLARKLNQMSAFGAFFDPVADKLVVAGALVILLYLNRIDMVVALIIIGREIAISALREWMAQIGQAKSVAVAFIGKLKTTAQMVAIPMLLYEDELFGLVDCHALGTALIYLAALFTVISMLYYLRRALPLMRG
jgi:CDP-diacylglycerol--glycerol-3-phosphate 3-phosphatidyltransferase